jgi:NADPH:quinone reductase-like Zn-dependent oxidoreductase
MQEGERVAVAGASGAVGSMVVQLALRRGAKEVVCILRDPTRAHLLPKVATVIEEGNFWKEIDPVDLLVDMVGGEGLAKRLGLVRSGGRIALVGYASGPLAQLDLPEFLLGNVSILPVNMMHHNTDDEAEVLHEGAALLASGELCFHVKPFPLEDVAECIRNVKSGEIRARPVLAI